MVRKEVKYIDIQNMFLKNTLHLFFSEPIYIYVTIYILFCMSDLIHIFF